MASTAAQKKASRKYDSKNVVQIGLRLNKKNDVDIIEYLERQDSKMGCIKEAIREKMKREG